MPGSRLGGWRGLAGVLALVALAGCGQPGAAPSTSAPLSALQPLALEGHLVRRTASGLIPWGPAELRFSLVASAEFGAEPLELSRALVGAAGHFAWFLPGEQTLPCLNSKVQPNCLISLPFGLFGVPGQRLRAEVYQGGVRVGEALPLEEQNTTRQYLYVERALRIETDESPAAAPGASGVRVELNAGWNQVRTEQVQGGQLTTHRSEPPAPLVWELRPDPAPATGTG